MAQEILVKEVLSSDEIDAGVELLRLLDSSTQLKVIAAYWIFVPEVGAWRLMFVSPQVETKGPLRVYMQIFQLLNLDPRLSFLIPSDRISVEGPNYSSYKEILSAVNSKKKLTGVRFNHLVVGGQIADLYIYRLPAKTGH
jgi:hypothetical protein